MAEIKSIQAIQEKWGLFFLFTLGLFYRIVRSSVKCFLGEGRDAPPNPVVVTLLTTSDITSRFWIPGDRVEIRRSGQDCAIA